MFERRLKFLLVLFALPAIAIAARLFHLQVLEARDYTAQAEQLLVRPVRLLPCLRGDITDHEGKVRLAYDAPSWNIAVQYRALAGDRDYLRALARSKYPGLDLKTAEENLVREVQASWRAIAVVSNTPLAELEQRRRKILADVTRVKEAVSQRRQVQTVVTEEDMPHAVVEGLDQNQQVLARERLRGYEWVDVVADQMRQYAGGPAFGHLLGRLSEVGPDDLESEANSDDPLSALLRGDRHGVSGLEAVAERWLRGRRGRIQEDRSGNQIAAAIEPQSGRTYRLTIDYALQQAMYTQLRDWVEHIELSTGGCAVLLDIPSRQILAVVSYPSHDPNISWSDWAKVADDEFRTPAMFRALQIAYPPGSIVKPMLLAGALTDGTVSPDTHITCEGRLFRETPDHWRCTAIHGSVDPVFAIQHSCNVFFYRLGELMGPQRLRYWMSQFGLGVPTGLRFPQETPGRILSDPLDPRTKMSGVGQQRLAAIGQGEVEMTPVQAVNMIATVASGVYRAPALWADDPTPRLTSRPPVSDAAWRLVRQGMYRAVNEVGGSAHSYATLTDAGDYVLLGKTGTATARRRVVEQLYTVHLPDGSVREEVAPSAQALKRKYPGATVAGGRPQKYWPPEEIDPSHAWFAGYLAPKSNYLEPASGPHLSVAIAVVVEYAGHGGPGAGPLAREMLQTVLQRQDGTLEPTTAEGRP
jgi:penicillin-binding protein 2